MTTRERRRPGAAAPASEPVSQRELDAELRGISFKLKVIGAIAALNLPLNVYALIVKSTPAPVALIERLFS